MDADTGTGIDSDDLRQKYSFSYFMKTNHLNKGILLKQKSFSKYIGNRWVDLPEDRKDLLFDFLLVDDEIRRHYDGLSPPSHAKDVNESFPRLKINSGQKINVDFESDLWTWRDEHSGPFSWYSKSQQDLTLADLDSENISKPQPKVSRDSEEEEDSVKKAERQFTYPSSIWCHDHINEYRKHEREISVSPSTSINFPTITKEEASPEVINPAFEDSSDDLPPVPSVPQGSELNADTSKSAEPHKRSRGKDRNRRRSPSPKKILRPGSLRRSPSKNGVEKLIDKNDVDTDDGNNVFTNPAMESEWSTFVGESGQDGQTAGHQGTTTAPEPMAIDRRADLSDDSPYRGDDIRLIQQPSASPAVQSSTSASYAHPLTSQNWSAESTPDHNTHLLKGHKSPIHGAHHVQYLTDETFSLGPYPGESTDELQKSSEEVDEILKVERDGENFAITSEVENKRDSSHFKTGFDFLDDW